jgi:hypothetical protein
LEDEVWDVRFHLDGKDNLERKLGKSYITYTNMLAMLEIRGYGWGYSMYFVKEEGAGIEGMALINSMIDVEEMLELYKDAGCVSISVTKGESCLPADINRKQCEEQIPISEIGVPVVYSVDMQGVLTTKYHLVHAIPISVMYEDCLSIQKSQVPVITKGSDDDMYSSTTGSQSFQTPPKDSEYNYANVEHIDNLDKKKRKLDSPSEATPTKRPKHTARDHREPVAQYRPKKFKHQCKAKRLYNLLVTSNKFAS